MSPSVKAWPVALLMAVAGCTAAGIRPLFQPLTGAKVDTIPGSPDSAVVRLAAELTTLGVGVAAESPAEGYVESRWYDLQSSRAVSQYHLASEHVIKLRAWADGLPPERTIVILEAVYRYRTDPSTPSRELEALAPPGHPADSLVLRMLQSVKAEP